MIKINSAEYYSSSSAGGACNKPTNTADGDIMFALVRSNSAYANSVPTGWIRLGQMNSTYFYELYYKIASSEGASYTWRFASSQKNRVKIITYRGGFNKYNPIAVVSNTAYTTSDATLRATGMTVPSKNSPLIFFASVYYTSGASFTKPSVPTTDWVEDEDTGDSSSDFWEEICSMTWNNASGATGNIDATANTSFTNKHAFAVALNPLENHTSVYEGCVAHYTFDDSNSNDLSTNENNGTDTDITYVDGKQGKCASFNGSTSKINCGDVCKLSNEMSFSAWFKTNTLSGTPVILAKTNEFLIRQDGSNLTFRLFDGTDWEPYVSAGTIETNRWYHVVCTHTISAGVATKKIYLDGSLIAENTQSGTFATSTNSLEIGVWAGGSYFDGLIDEVAIWNRALSLSEIQLLYALPKQLHNGLVSYWKLDGNSYDFVGKNDGQDANVSYNASYGKIGQGVRFDADGSTSKISLNKKQTEQNGTISLWFKINNSNKNCLFSQSRQSGGYDYLFLQMWNAISLEICSGNSIVLSLTTQNEFDDNTWHNLVVTGGSGGNKIYVDGVLQSVNYSFGNSSSTYWFSTIQSVTTFQGFGIFSSPDGAINPTSGDIDEVAIWNRALTENEIKLLYYNNSAQQYPLTEVMDITNQASAEVVTSSIPAPTINLDMRILSAVQTIISSVQSPTINLGITILPEAEVMTASVEDPFILIGDVLITPSAMEVVSSIEDPEILYAMKVLANTLSATFNTNNVIIETAVNISPNAILVTASVKDPAIRLGIIIEAQSQLVTATFNAPDIMVETRMCVDTQIVNSSIVDPIVTLASIVTTDEIMATFILNDPFVKSSNYQRKYTTRGNIYSVKYT